MGSWVKSVVLPRNMADIMWGGVPFQLPSKTAIKYLGRAVKVKRECDIPVGGRYNARQTMEKEIIGHRQTRKDLIESYDNYDIMKRRAISDPPLTTCPGVCPSKMKAVFRTNKPYIGMTEPRAESFIGMVDVRKRLPGYIGGKRARDCAFS